MLSIGPMESVLLFFLVLLPIVASFVIGVLMIIGALQMMRLQSYGWAMTATILAFLPSSPAGLLGLAMGIWSLVVLNRREVKEAFRGAATAPKSSGKSGRDSRGLSAILLILLVGAALLVVGLPVLLVLGYFLLVG